MELLSTVEIFQMPITQQIPQPIATSCLIDYFVHTQSQLGVTKGKS